MKEKLKKTGLWDVDSANLFRITWKNEPVKSGGLFGGVNYIELPSALTGVDARIVAIAGKWFPTGAHKVGASFGCLAPRLVTGQFDPLHQKAVWPSTGNYCRGGAYNAQLLGCESIAILPEGMSRERFEWLETVAGEIIATPGTESNVKEIYDKVWELRNTRDNIVVFNQFDEMGNHLWHYEVTGHAMEEDLREVMKPGDRYAGVAVTSGSAGTTACGDYLKEIFPGSKVAVGEASSAPPCWRTASEPTGSKVSATSTFLGAQREEHRHGHGHRRRGQHGLHPALQRTRRKEVLRSLGLKDEFIDLLPLMGISVRPMSLWPRRWPNTTN